MVERRESPVLRSLGPTLVSFQLLVLAQVPTAHATEVCADLDTLIREAHSDFSSWASETNDSIVPLKLPFADHCALARSSTGSGTYYCTRDYSYRSAEAYETYGVLGRSLFECLGPRVRISTDHRVNHPDSYDQRQYHLDQVKVTLSIKDKSAQRRTIVFLQFRGPDAE